MSSRYTAIYARQSVDKKDSLSIEGQIDLCKKEAQNSETVVYRDRGFSGKNTKRPEFSRMLRDIEAGLISKVVCYRLDRISRSITDFGAIWETLSQHGVEFISVNEKFDTQTPMGRAMLYIIMVFAQLERETIAERIRDNYYQRVRAGAWPGGPAPYGFSVKKERGHNAALAPNELLESVPKIFALYLQPGASLSRVCRELSQLQIPCAKRQNWDTVSLNRLLRNPVYVKTDPSVYSYYVTRGVLPCNDVAAFEQGKGALLINKTKEPSEMDGDGPLITLLSHDGVVSSSVFLGCQHKLDANRQLSNSGKGRYTWLSGLLKCRQCGYSLKVVNDSRTGIKYLACSGRANLGVCDCRHAEKPEEIEQIVSGRLEQFLAQIPIKAPSSASGEVLRLTSALLDIDAKVQALVQSLYSATPPVMQYVNEEVARLEKQKKQKEAALIALTGQTEAAASFTAVDFGASQFESKKLIAQALIEKVCCDSSHLEIVWKF